jgi:hypothetical protein
VRDEQVEVRWACIADNTFDQIFDDRKASTNGERTHIYNDIREVCEALAVKGRDDVATADNRAIRAKNFDRYNFMPRKGLLKNGAIPFRLIDQALIGIRSILPNEECAHVIALSSEQLSDNRCAGIETGACHKQHSARSVVEVRFNEPGDFLIAVRNARIPT